MLKLLLNHYWLFLLEYFFPSQGGPWAKRLCRPYAYEAKPKKGAVSMNRSNYSVF